MKLIVDFDGWNSAATDTAIASADVTLAAPVAGSPASSAIASVSTNDQYEATSTMWKVTDGAAVDGSFTYETAYTATVTLTSKTGYKFDNSTTVSTTPGTAGIPTVNGTDSGNTLTVDVSFAMTGSEPVDEDQQAVDAAIEKVVAGEVNVDFGADQTAKTAAVKTYVESLLSTEITAGMSVSVTYASGNDYSVTLTKNGKTTNKSIAMTVTEGENPQIALDQQAVDSAATAIANAFADVSVAQATVNDETAAKSYVENIISKLTLNDCTTAVTKVGFTAAVEDTAGDAGSDGAYTFTVNVSKGLAVAKDTVTLTLTITKTPYVAPDGTAVPVFASQSYTLTSESADTAEFTMTNTGSYSGTLVWTVYEQQADGSESAVTANYEGGTLTLTGVSAQTYYVSVQEDTKTASSPRVPLTVNAYVAPVKTLGGSVSIDADASPIAEGTQLTANTSAVTASDNGTPSFTYKWTRGAATESIGTDAAYTVAAADLGETLKCEVSASGYENSLSATASVPAAAGDVIPEFPNIPGATPDAEEKVYTSEVKDSEDTSAVMGTITLRRADGKAFKLESAVPADVVFTLTAEPKEGYKFSGWSKASPVMLMALAEGEMDLSQPTVSGTYSELSQLSATFAPKVVAGEPTLRALQLTGMPQNRSLIQADGAYTKGFTATETGYELYFLPGETVNFTLTPVVSAAGNYTVKIGDNTAETFTAAEGAVSGTKAGAPVAVTGTADTAVNVVITDTDSSKSTTYTITPKVNLPQAKLVLSDQMGGTKVSELNMSFTDAYFDAAEFSIKLSDLTAYQGFATSAGVLLDADAELKAVANAFTGGLKNFEVDSLTVDSTTNTLTIRITSKTGAPASGENETLTLYLLQQDTYSSATAGIATLSSDMTSRMDDVRYVAVINDGLNKAETSLVYMVAESANWELYAYANKEGNNAGVTRVSYVIKSGGVQIATGGTGSLDQFGGLSVLVNNGTYEITFTADGYKTTAKTVVVKDADKGIPAFMLLAGDVNGDGAIDDADRQALMTVYGEAAADGVTSAGSVKADFNDDNVVDIFDLGALLRNLGK